MWLGFLLGEGAGLLTSKQLYDLEALRVVHLVW